MSEPIFAQPGAAAPAVAEPEPVSGGNRKALLAVGGVVAALAVGAGAFFLLTGSSGGEVDAALAPVPKASAPAVAPSPAASAPATTVKVKPAKVTARDPFVVLFPDPAPSAAATQPAASGDGTTATTPTNVQPQTTSYVVNVTAIDPAAGTATVKVGDKSYKTAVGTQFAPYFTLYAVFNTQCVGVLFGDQNVPVCQGTPTTVTQ